MPGTQVSANSSTRLNGFFRRDRPPPVPEKDVFLSPKPPASAVPYASSSASLSTTSLSASSMIRSLSPRSNMVHDVPSFTPSPNDNQQVPPHQPPPPYPGGSISSGRGGLSSFRKAIARIPGSTSLTKAPSTSSTSSLKSSSPQLSSDGTGDENISLPWNISVCVI